MLCTNCGTEFEGKFCPKCGTPAVPTTAPDSMELTVEQPVVEDEQPEALVTSEDVPRWKKALKNIFDLPGIVGIALALLYMLSTFEKNRGVPLTTAIGVFTVMAVTYWGLCKGIAKLSHVIKQKKLHRRELRAEQEKIKTSKGKTDWQNAACSAEWETRQPPTAPRELPYGFSIKEMDKIYPAYGKNNRTGFAAFISNRFRLTLDQANEIVDAYAEMFPNKPEPSSKEMLARAVRLGFTNPPISQRTIMQEKYRAAEKARIAENKLNKIPMCPKCKSTSIQPDNGKFHLGRAIVGDTLLGSGGAVMGLTHGKKVPMICLNCGHRWKLK